MRASPKCSKVLEDEEEDSNCKTVLLTSFIIRKKRCRVYFHQNTLIWETEKKLPYSEYFFLDVN